MTYEKDENGRLLMNLRKVMEDSGEIENYTRYNGGWIKQITGLDKSRTDGFSILGEFADKGLTWHEPGLYVDCSIGGSRKNQDRWFTMFVLSPDGEIKKVGKWMKYDGHSGGDWAPHFWPEITKQLELLNTIKPDASKPFAVLTISRDMLAERYGCEKAYDLTDEQMEQIAETALENFWNEMLGDAFDEAIEQTLDRMGINLEKDDD